MLIERKIISDLAHQIAHEFQPERVILFGSYAYGSPKVDSDVDLLVVMSFDGSGGAKALEIMQKLGPRIPLDLVVRRPDAIYQRLVWNDYFLKEIEEKGEVLYESTDA